MPRAFLDALFSLVAWPSLEAKLHCGCHRESLDCLFFGKTTWMKLEDTAIHRPAHLLGAIFFVDALQLQVRDRKVARKVWWMEATSSFGEWCSRYQR